MPDPLLDGCRVLTGAAARTDRRAFDAALSTVYGRAAFAGPAERHGAMTHLGSQLERLDPEYASWVALLAGVLTEYGTDAAPVVAPVLGFLKTVAEAAAYFADAWRDATDDPLPDPVGTPPDTIYRVVHPALGDATVVVVDAWWALPRWAGAARSVLGGVGGTGLSVPDRALLLRVLSMAAVHRPEPGVVRDLLVGL